MKKTIKQAGFSPVMVLLILVIVGIIGFTGWYVYSATQNNNKIMDSMNDSTVITDNNQTPQTSTTTNKITSNIVDFDTVKVGDQVAGMKIVSISSLNPSGPMAANNVKIVFNGTATIKGEVRYEPNSLVGGFYVSFVPAADSLKYIPILKGDERTTKWFTNEEATLDMLGFKGEEAKTINKTITIQDYTIQYAPASVLDTMTLVKVN